MSKQKTVSGAKKRFFLTDSGRVKREHACKSYILTKKGRKRKHNLTYTALMHPHNEHNVKGMLNL